MVEQSRVAALILAGGTLKPEMAAVAGGATNRALIDLNGRPMLQYVTDAIQSGLNRAGKPGRLLVAGDVPLADGQISVPGGASLVDTLLNGIAALEPHETRLLVATADIPFLTPEAVADFVTRATALEGARFVFPIVEAAACRARFPEMRRTTLKIAEGEFTGGNVVLLDPAFVREREALIRAAWNRRKSVPALAALLGPDLIFRLALSRAFPSLLRIAYAEAAVSRALGGANARALQTPYAEIGSDVDSPGDVQTARRILASG